MWWSSDSLRFLLKWYSSISSSLTDFVKIRTLLVISLRHSCKRVSSTWCEDNVKHDKWHAGASRLTIHFPQYTGRRIAGPYFGAESFGKATSASSRLRAVWKRVCRRWKKAWMVEKTYLLRCIHMRWQIMRQGINILTTNNGSLGKMRAKWFDTLISADIYLKRSPATKG